MSMQKKTKIDGVLVTVPEGVVWLKDRRKWRARITVSGVKINLGDFDSLEGAVVARRSAAEVHRVKPKLPAGDEPPLQQLIDMLSYDPETGVIAWKPEDNKWIERVRPGVIRLFRTKFNEDRLAWRITRGKWPVHEVRHANGDVRDNQIMNIYDLPTAVICSKDRSALLVGVRARNNYFMVTVRSDVDGKLMVIGKYDTVHEAVYARLMAVQQRNALKLQAKKNGKLIGVVVEAPAVQTKRQSRW